MDVLLNLFNVKSHPEHLNSHVITAITLTTSVRAVLFAGGNGKPVGVEDGDWAKPGGMVLRG